MTHSSDPARDVVDRASARLSTRRLGRVMRAYEVATSTNALALEWAEHGAPAGAVVYAEYQEHGRGRMGRTWSARAGLNLTFSVILRPTLSPDRWGMITIAAGVAIAETIELFTDPVRAQIKWPNDILLDGRKCCGMLLESTSSTRRSGDRSVVLGIGLNVNQDRFPAELEKVATSILLSTGRPAGRPDLLAGILNHLEETLEALIRDERDVRTRYLARMRDLNAPVELRFTERGGTIRGVASGLGETGGLLLSTDKGMHVYHAGEVTRST